MSKIKELKEKRASVFAKIDELRSATDGRSMNAEEQQRWDTLIAEYSSLDKEVEAEERYEQIQKRQAEQQGKWYYKGEAEKCETCDSNNNRVKNEPVMRVEKRATICNKAKNNPSKNKQKNE